MGEVFVESNSLIIAENDGMFDLRPKVIESTKDVVVIVPEIVAGDEGMVDRREMRAGLEARINS